MTYLPPSSNPLRPVDLPARVNVALPTTALLSKDAGQVVDIANSTVYDIILQTILDMRFGKARSGRSKTYARARNGPITRAVNRQRVAIDKSGVLPLLRDGTEIQWRRIANGIARDLTGAHMGHVAKGFEGGLRKSTEALARETFPTLGDAHIGRVVDTTCAALAPAFLRQAPDALAPTGSIWSVEPFAGPRAIAAVATPGARARWRRAMSDVSAVAGVVANDPGFAPNWPAPAPGPYADYAAFKAAGVPAGGAHWRYVIKPDARRRRAGLALYLCSSAHHAADAARHAITQSASPMPQDWSGIATTPFNSSIAIPRTRFGYSELSLVARELAQPTKRKGRRPIQLYVSSGPAVR